MRKNIDGRAHLCRIILSGTALGSLAGDWPGENEFLV